MTVKLGILMDPIAAINTKKDSTLAMMLEAQRRGWSLVYLEQGDLFTRDGRAWARMRTVTVADAHDRWFELGEAQTLPLAELDALLMRKDPPFDLEYLYSTYVLELAEREGVLVVNRPAALRNHNEKFAVSRFPDCAPPTLVTRERARIRDFAEEHGEIVVKPLDSMGGSSVFRLCSTDLNFNVVLELMTANDRRTVMAQRFIPEITQGDKRVLLVDGKPVPYMLARIPPAGEARGNLAVGGRGEGRPLGARERWICEQVGPVLREEGLLFVGLDIIGDYLTEINVTSPTGIRELDRQFELNIAGLLLDAVASRIDGSPTAASNTSSVA